MEEIQQSVGLAVLRTVLGDCCEYPFGVGPEDSEFNKVGRIEKDVGIFLERIYPPDL